MSDSQQIGCTSPEHGAVGVLYLVNSTSTLNAFVDNSPDRDTIVLLDQVMLNAENLARLKSKSKCKGIMVYDDATGPTEFSPDHQLPNFRNGLPYGTTGRVPTVWNPNGGGFNLTYTNSSEGMHFIDIQIPLFYLDPSDKGALFECYNAHNRIVGGKNPDYDLCALELNNWMYGVKDSALCLDRGYCDPLGNQSPFASLRPITNEEVVVIAAQIDSLALFHDLVSGANADISGAVALLGAAKLLSRSENSASRSLKRNILFLFFHGEAFGYIGSSKIANDMALNLFPSSDYFVNLANISYYLELNQLSAGDPTLHMHTYNPLNGSPSTRASDIVTALPAAATSMGASISFTTDPTTDLPPSSMSAFLNELRTEAGRNAFGGVVLTDHHQSFANQFYHSRLDNAKSVNFDNSSSAQVSQLCSLAGVVAKTAWALADDLDPTAFTMPNETADCAYIAELLRCITVDQNCSLVEQFTGVSYPGKPMNRYVGVYVQGYFGDVGTQFLFSALANAAAINSTNCSSSCHCASNTGTNGLTRLLNNDKTCIVTSAFNYPAISPAFSGAKLRPLGTAAKNYTDGRDPRYSTWTESRWGSTSVRMFLASSPESKWATFGLGLAVLFSSFAIVFLCQKWTMQNSARMPLQQAR